MRGFMGISVVVLGATIFGSSFGVVATWAQSSVKCQPGKTLVFTGGAKISDKIGILKQFVHSGIGKIFLGGKMANAFLVAKHLLKRGESPSKIIIPSEIISCTDAATAPTSIKVRIISIAKFML